MLERRLLRTATHLQPSPFRTAGRSLREQVFFQSAARCRPYADRSAEENQRAAVKGERHRLLSTHRTAQSCRVGGRIPDGKLRRESRSAWPAIDQRGLSFQIVPRFLRLDRRPPRPLLWNE